jgi:hypothetical protein
MDFCRAETLTEEFLSLETKFDVKLKDILLAEFSLQEQTLWNVDNSVDNFVDK